MRQHGNPLQILEFYFKSWNFTSNPGILLQTLGVSPNPGNFLIGRDTYHYEGGGTHLDREGKKLVGKKKYQWEGLHINVNNTWINTNILLIYIY